MITDPRQQLEDQLLLRSTGELPPDELTTLDAEATAFAKFIEQDLPTAARAPRDFAAEAIAAQHEAQVPRDFAAQSIKTAMPKRKTAPLLWSMAAAAVLLVSVLTFQLTRQSDTLAAASPRTTVAISERLNELESEVITTRSRYSQGRYATPTTL